MKPARILDIEETHTPALSYPRVKKGVAQLVEHQISNGIYEMYGVNGYKYFKALKPLRSTLLKIRRKVWMTDDPPHWFAMLEHAQCYSGHVLCAGLGLGLIVHALHDNPRVKKITVIEREQDVIDLVRQHLPKKKLTILHGDFWDLDPFIMEKVDGVFYDLFVGKGRELLTQAMRVWFDLHERWPRTVRRIHGFDNNSFESLDKLIERL